MFEFFEMLNFGQKIKAHGKEWQSIKTHQNGYHSAIEIGSKLPCQLYLVKVEENDLEEE